VSIWLALHFYLLRDGVAKRSESLRSAQKEIASNMLDLIAYVSRLDRDIFAGSQLRRPRRGKITGKNGETAAAAETETEEERNR